MGMYTQLVMGVNVKGDAPKEVIEVLEYMLNHEMGEQPKVELPSHPLFQSGRWRYMLMCDSYYFDGQTVSKMDWDEIGKEWNLSIRCNLKNYDNEIENFCDWINPYISTEGFIGYKQYEEADDPTLIYRNEGIMTYTEVPKQAECEAP